MKNSKLITSLVLALFFAFAASGFAADGDKKKGKKGKGNNLMSKLELKPEQRKAIQTFQKSNAAKRKEIASIEDKKAKREKSQELSKAYQAKLKEVLTEAQFKKFQDLQAEARKGKGKGKGKGDKKKKDNK